MEHFFSDLKSTPMDGIFKKQSTSKAHCSIIAPLVQNVGSQSHKAVSEAKVWRNEIDHSQRAVWWHATDYSGQEPPDRLRVLNGELHLKPDMTPTSAIVTFRLNYSVILLPFNTPGFKVEGRTPFLEQAITIVTSFAPGPRPRVTTPADYTPDVKMDAEELQTNGEFSNGFY
ncbi:hypothetical protein GALMADRAFT_214649 [Galerina marginata CBS 339.88]|uniref:Arrestin-like N-terminal domain-containing protein n=1 Tax=Galerina marginata (strain CBS 339.88) TaxID=685588 RepID=A0A067SH15_GALM3|nr:hypothetical protein GALMADRAFT_214649 [Galerina marginata CBS 339.88]